MAPAGDDAAAAAPCAAPAGLGEAAALPGTPTLLMAKSAADTPAAEAMVWNVDAKDAPRLDAGAAARAARALVSADRLAADADACGRTVASQVTSALAS